eukprot:TRINITY_DN2944_c0_g1_i1.p1 TRINITY_DN2944_c0_g1~~TRINITY_DN2944_c0_g1_i1.p1  ORF type:complete len:395 (-),score=52.80 TRINITY_DN2944_c0_g1_i1:174-1358(-)
MSSSTSIPVIRRRGESSPEKRILIAFFRVVVGLSVMAIFLFLATDEIVQSIEYETVVKELEVSEQAFTMVRLLGTERFWAVIGASGNWTSTLANDRYESQKVLVDNTRTAFLQSLKTIEYNSTYLVTKVQNLRYNFAAMRYLARNTTNATIDEIAEAYTEFISVYLTFCQDFVVTQKVELTRMLLTRLYLAWIQENTSLLRGLLGAIFTRKYYSSFDEYITIVRIDQSRYKFEDQFLGFAPNEYVTLYNDTLKKPTIATALNVTLEFRNLALSWDPCNASTFNVSVLDWYRNTTVVIDAYSNVSSVISSAIKEGANTYRSSNIIVVIIGFIIETIASVSLIVMGWPIFVFFCKTHLSSLSDKGETKHKPTSRGSGSHHRDESTHSTGSPVIDEP